MLFPKPMHGARDRRGRPWNKSLFSHLFYFLVIGWITTAFGLNTVQGAGGIFPKIASAESVEVYDLRGDTAEARLSAVALQGLLNQTGARIFLQINVNDLAWLQGSAKPYTIKPLRGGSNPGFRTLFAEHATEVRKFIVYDAGKDWTFNLALMKGAVSAGIPVTPTLKTMLEAEFGPIVLEDLRLNWRNRVEAYGWARSNLASSLNKRLFFSAGLRSDWPTNPWLIFDYAVATRSFCFWLDEADPSEREEIIKICQLPGYPTNSTLMGYGYHGDELLNTVEPLGVGWVVSDYLSNESVWSSFPNKTYSQPQGVAGKAQPNTIYVALQWSDGDNLQFDANAMRILWGDPQRGMVPVGTTLSPVMQEVASPILDWYYANRTPADELMAGPHGWQFIYTPRYKTNALDSWLAINRQWCADAGFHVANVDGQWGDEINNRYMMESGLDGVFQWNAGPYRLPYFFGDCVQLATSFVATHDGDVYNQLALLKPDSSRPLFETIDCTVATYALAGSAGVGYTRLLNEINRLQASFPGRFVFLKPGDLVATAKAYYSAQFEQINVDVEVGPANFNSRAGVGILGGGYWNELIPTVGSITRGFNLVDSNGTTTTRVSVSCNALNSFNAGGNFGLPLSLQTDGLLGDYLYVGPGKFAVTLSGLEPSGSYDLVVYGVGGAPGQAAMVTGAVTGKTSATIADRFVVGNNYLENKQAVADVHGVLQFEMQNTRENNFAAFNGLQIRRNSPVVLTLQRSSNQQLFLNWPRGTLLEADQLGGPWRTNSQATAPYPVSTNATQRFYKILL